MGTFIDQVRLAGIGMACGAAFMTTLVLILNSV